MSFDEQSGESEPVAEPGLPYLPPDAEVQMPAPKQERTGLIVGVSVLAVIVAAACVYAGTSSGGSAAAADGGSSVSDSPVAEAAAASPSASAAGTMKMPTSAGTMSLMTDTAAGRVTTELRQANYNYFPNSALYGAYEKTGTSTYVGNLILLELSDGDASEYANLYTSTDADTALLQINGTTGVTGFTTETPANSGGAIICGTMTSAAKPVTVRVCEWIDATEYGMAGFPMSVSEAQADAYSTVLWKASEAP